MRQLVKYVIVGSIGYAVNLATYWLVTVVIGVDEYLAILPAFITNTTSNYVLNRAWTFAPEHAATKLEMVKFLIVSFSCVVVSTGAFHLYFGVMDAPSLLAQALAVATCLPVGFLGMRLWAFAAPADVPDADATTLPSARATTGT